MMSAINQPRIKYVLNNVATQLISINFNKAYNEAIDFLAYKIAHYMVNLEKKNQKE